MGCWGNGMIITSDYGSFPHSLLSTSKKMVMFQRKVLKVETIFVYWFDYFDHGVYPTDSNLDMKHGKNT